MKKFGETRTSAAQAAPQNRRANLNRMGTLPLGVLLALSWGGCAVKNEPIDSEQPADSAGGSENASGGQGGDDGGSGGTIVDLDSLLVAEGEVLSGSCMAPDGRGPCRDYLVVAGLGYTEEEGYMDCAQRYDDAFGDDLWRGGEHCPLEGAAYACSHGSIIIYHYGNLLPEARPEEACESGGRLVYWSRTE